MVGNASSTEVDKCADDSLLVYGSPRGGCAQKPSHVSSANTFYLIWTLYILFSSINCRSINDSYDT